MSKTVAIRELENQELAYRLELEERANEINRINKKIIEEKISVALQDLTDRERFVIEEYFGFTNNDTLTNIGKKLNVSRTRAAQIKESVLRKLRRKEYNLKELLTLIR